MDLTILRQISQQSRVTAILQDSTDLNKLYNILEPTDNYGVDIKTSLPQELGPEKTAMFFSKVPDIFSTASSFKVAEYNLLLNYLHRSGRPYRAYTQIPHPLDSVVLQPLAHCPLYFKRGDHTFSCQSSHKGNSAIQFYNPTTRSKETGFIHAIWQVPLESKIQTFIAVLPHVTLLAFEEQKGPFIDRPELQTRILSNGQADDVVVIEPLHIITHLTTYIRPAGTYGIERETLVVCWGLNRGRR